MISPSDEIYGRLKVRGYDKDGNERIAYFAQIVGTLDLSDFINDDVKDYAEQIMRQSEQNMDYRTANQISNPYTAFDPKVRYKELRVQEIDDIFNTYKGNDGWIDLRNNNIFNKNSKYINFAYKKQDFAGNTVLSEFNPIIEPGENNGTNVKDFSYTKYQKDTFMKFYDEYKVAAKEHERDLKELIDNLDMEETPNQSRSSGMVGRLNNSKSEKMLAMEKEFKKVTGLNFHEETLEEVKKEFDTDSDKAAIKMRDSDSVIAMKLNDDGSITLKFDSGREIEVRELYSDTGKLLEDGAGRRASINLETKDMNDIEPGSINFKEIGILETNGRYKTLQEIGATAIKSFSTKHGKQFLIYLGDNKTLTAKDLYKISFLNNELKNSEKIDEKDRFYRKVDVRV